jgi:hypothetical protein
MNISYQETLLTLPTAEKCKLFQLESLYVRMYKALLTISQNLAAEINNLPLNKVYNTYHTAKSHKIIYP